MSIEGKMSEIQDNNDVYSIPNFSFEFEELPDIEDSSHTEIFEEPVTDNDFTPRMPRKGEIRHWNSQLKRSDPSLIEDPTNNSLFTPAEQQVVDRIKAKLESNEENPAAERVVEELPPKTSRWFKNHILKHGTDEEKMPNPDLLPAEDKGFEETENKVYAEQLREKLDTATATWPESERKVLEAFTMKEGTTLDSASLNLDMSRIRVRQLNDRVIEKLRDPNGELANFLGDYIEPQAPISQSEEIEAILEGEFAPKLPGKIEMGRWNIQLRKGYEPLQEEPLENPILGQEQQIRIDNAVHKLKKQGVEDPSRTQIAEAIPRTDPGLKKFVRNHGTTVENIDEVNYEIPFEEVGFEEVEDRLFHEQLKKQLEKAKATLPERDWLIIEALNSSENPPDVKDLVEVFNNISEERIRLINRNTLNKIKVQNSELVPFTGDFSENKPEITTSDFTFPDINLVPLRDSKDKRPYVERIQDYCETETREWVEDEKRKLERGAESGKLMRISQNLNKVEDELGILKKTHSQIIMRASSDDPFNNPDLRAVNIRIFVLDAWKYELEQRKSAFISERNETLKRIINENENF